MVSSAEGFAGHRYNVRFGQQLAGQLRSCSYRALTQEALNVWVYVEGTLRHRAVQPWDRLKAFQYTVAQLHVSRPHLLNTPL